MHGPCSVSWLCPDYAIAPERPGGRTKFRVIDSVLETIRLTRPRKRAKWIRARDWALAEWEQTGIKFLLETDSGARYSYFDPEHPEDTYATPLIVPGAIRIVRNITKAPEGVWQRDDFAILTGGGAVAAIDLEKTVTGPLYELGRLTCHEIGHCLGLAHGSNGIMMGGLVPNAHDLDSIRSYY